MLMPENTMKIDIRDDGVYIVINNANATGKITKKNVLDLIAEHQLQEVDQNAVNAIFQKDFLHIEAKITNNKTIAIKHEAVKVEISPDKMMAFISFVKPGVGGQAATFDKVVSELNFADVKQGIDPKAIETALAEKEYGKRYLVASGVPAVEGRDGHLDFLFGVSGKSAKPKITADGRADFHDLHIFEPAEKGQELAIVYPAIDGTKGVNVFGQDIPYRAVKPAPAILGGKNTELIGDEKLVSTASGQVIFDGKRVSVDTVLDIGDDIGIATGNVEFKGDVIVRGSVMTGFSVIAEGLLEIYGSVEGAYLKSGGDMKIHGGIHGLEKAEIISEGNITAKFIESSKVSSDGDIYANNILHSFVSCAGSVLLEGSKCMIAGGKINAGKSIKAKTIGSTMATVTEINIGILPKILERYEECKAEYQKLRTEFDKISNVCNILLKLKEANQLSEEKKDVFLKAMYSKTFLRDRLDALTKEIDALSIHWAGKNEGVLYASAVVRPGVRVTIGDAMLYVRDDIEACRLYNDNGTILIGSYTGG
jgi:uncharacterized protein (DUF342 family)